MHVKQLYVAGYSLLVRRFRDKLVSTYQRRMSAVSKDNSLVAVVQMRSTSDKEHNKEQALNLIERAKSRGAKVVFLPECFDVIGESREGTLAAAEPLDGGTIDFYKKIAKEKNLWLSLGGFHERPVDFEKDRRIFNTHLMIDNNGEIKAKYSKTHLFDLDIKGGVRLKETDLARPGMRIEPPLNTPAGNVGLAICYDMRFPELSIALAQQGADILTFPSAFTVPTGMAHWHTLLRSRAIENQCYVIAAAQVGKHNEKRSSYGHALIVDPWGCVVAECTNQPDVAVAEIDLTYMRKVRTEMPVWDHRRHDLYGNILVHNVHNDFDENTQSYAFGQVTVPSSAVFYKSGLSYAFVNRKPVIPGHVLVSPLRRVERFDDLTSQEIADLWQVVQRVAKALEKEFNSSSTSMAVQDGPEAGQTISHVHVHVLPRKAGDFPNNDDIYKELEEHDKQVRDSEWRTDEELAEEAIRLRELFR